MHPDLTWELRVSFAARGPAAAKLKQRLTDWLLLNGVESFVEGALDVDFNLNQDEPPRDFYTEMGGDDAPISIYRYSVESLQDLRTRLEHAFRGQVELAIHSSPTQEWMEGWKESFKPFNTVKFRVRPPWIEEPLPPGLMDLVIEPGMAFGTGQHATTRLCLEALERIAAGSGAAIARQRVLDVGTGTGILAIGARLLGYGGAAGTDIEDDAVLAANANAALNQVQLAVSRGSIPEGGPWDLVFANILAVVLLRMMDDLAGTLTPGGHLIMSGLLAEEEPEIIARARAAGLLLVESTQHSGWSCVVVSRPTPGTGVRADASPKNAGSRP